MSNDDKNDIKNGVKDKTKYSFSPFVAFGKDLVALLRDLVLFIIAMLLLFFPTTFNSVLSNAGFEEGSFVGFKWKPKLLNSDAALKEARALIIDLNEQNNNLVQALGDAQSKLNDSDLKEQYAKLEEANKQLRVDSSKVEASVELSIASNAPLVKKVQDIADTNARTGVVLSGDARIYLLSGKKDKETLFEPLKIEMSGAGFAVIGAKSLIDPGRPDHPEVRYFHNVDKAQAEKLAEFMRFKLNVDTLSAKQYQDAKARPGYIEIWLGR